ncbi:hypothetical protein BDV98DRAFT_281055 [Pterulicium gracile]|uniref:Tail specific protease domain-containing protein n=1 Tax=Pterulicium gracile TaxID=1884261 RepID=A0A5C3QW33_9AGAR|nr:hypothetical protein BDV98DRAFT_281055 [Pterula gracilis]
MKFPFLSTLGLAVLSFAATLAPTNGEDPCTKIANRTFVPPAEVLTCMKSFPYNRTLHTNVINNVARVMDFFTFEPYYIRSPQPFEDSTVNIRRELKRINNTRYATDFDFNYDLYTFLTQLNDGHTRWSPRCYTIYQNILPTPIVSLAVDGVESLYVAPDAVEFISLLGSNYTDYFDEMKFEWKRLAGAKIVSIEGMNPYKYVDKVADTLSGNFLDHGIRVNSVFTTYRIVANNYTQRLGDLAGRAMPVLTHLTISLIPVNASRAERVRVPFISNFLSTGVPFADGPSYWTNNCLANENTNGVDYKDEPQLSPAVPFMKRARGDVIDQAAAIGIDLPTQFIPKLPPTPGSANVIKSYLLSDGVTGVMFVGSFGPDDFDSFMVDTVAAVTDLKSKGATRLLIDVTSNGGGYVCLGHYLHRYLGGATVTYSGFESTARGNVLAQKIVAADIALGLDDSFSFYSPGNWAFLNGTRMPLDYNYMNPTEPLVVNGQNDPTSQRFHDTCEALFLKPLPEEPPFPLDQVKIVGNGWCASTCAMFSTLMFEQHGTEIAVFGGRPGQPIEFKGMAGNQVLDWIYIDSEVKTAELKNDPLAPPDLLVNGNFRHNWRTAWSTVDKDDPIAYKSEPPTIRFPYTKETYNSPQAVWEFAASRLFS